MGACSYAYLKGYVSHTSSTPEGRNYKTANRQKTIRGFSFVCAGEDRYAFLPQLKTSLTHNNIRTIIHLFIAREHRMKIFEYMTLVDNCDSVVIDGKFSGAKTLDELNRLGKLGWELVAVVPDIFGDKGKRFWWLKREVVESMQAAA